MSEAIPWSFPKLEYNNPSQQHQMPRKEAEAIIQRAYIEAEQMKRDIVQEAEAEAAFLKERTREQAFMEGYEEGRQQAMAELQKERAAGRLDRQISEAPSTPSVKGLHNL